MEDKRKQRHPNSLKNLEKGAYKPGQSGNPNGRKKGSQNRATVARKWLELGMQYKNAITGEIEYLTQQDIITLAQIKKAHDADTAAYKAVMDSAYGQAAQELNHTHENAEPIVWTTWGVAPPADVEDLDGE